jgi:cation diffusion facilitator CzcD-associated flavoprotein CzcO
MPSSGRKSDTGHEYIPVLVIGAGASGICMGYQLKHKLGFFHFRILDRQSGIGGKSFSVAGYAIIFKD